MRILHVNKFLYRRGGAEGYMIDVARHQRAAGHDVRFFGMDHPENDQPAVVGPLPSHAEFEPPPPGASERLRLLARMVWSRESERAMRQAIATWRPDIVHAHNIYHQLSPSVLRPLAQAHIPVVLTMHDYKLACPTYQFLDHGRPCTACVDGGPWMAAKKACKDGSRAASTAAAAEVWLHRRFGAYDPVTRFVAPSQFLADQIARAGVYPDRIRVQDNFTDVHAVPEAAEAGVGVVFGGRLSHEKGVDTLVRAVGRLAQQTPAQTPLLHIAGDGPEKQALEQLAAEVAPGMVKFHGRLPTERLHELVRSAVVCAVPSRWYENQPLSVLESFSCGVPVVATSMGGLPEIVSHGETGWLFPADDVEALAEVLRQAMSDPLESRRRGGVARRVAEDRFSPERHLEALGVIYDECRGMDA